MLEYAADVANCAMFLADAMGALDLQLLHPGPIEYDSEHQGIATPEAFAAYKTQAHRWAEGMLT
jgi:hypothetical protein